MTPEELSDAFAVAIMGAESMESVIRIDGVPYKARDALAEQMDYPHPRDHMGDVFGVMARVARNGDAEALQLLKRIGFTFARFRADPEPDIDDIPAQPRTLGRDDNAMLAAMTRGVSL